jgi:hypothetical protein
MATKFKLGECPKQFKPFSVRFEMPDGSEGVIEVTYKYRTRNEYAEFISQHTSGVDAGDENRPFMQRIVDGLIAGNVSFLMGCVEAWNLDRKLGEEELRELANTVPAGAQALVDKYGRPTTCGRSRRRSPTS